MPERFIEIINPILIFLDLFIVSYFLYRIYILLNRTRAMQLIVGFGLILVIDIISRQFHLATVAWIIQNVSSYLVIGLIVLMQPELRRLFSEIGRMPIFQWISPTGSISINEICDAVRNMAQKKVGSLIVILREIRPHHIIDHAVKVDSAISSELLETIFFKDSPLHDGAVLIEGNRIVAASCYLPLSNSRILKKTHGARHRAGMGISEDTDAVVVVTSEETGSINVIVNGQLQNDISPLKLPLLLAEILEGKKSFNIFKS
ncbi:MAG: diadenylate cyclase CdaA [Spirochaetia bacterium]|nr:diadenylate cyclase CdaA [Spirochaetia bacterium]